MHIRVLRLYDCLKKTADGSQVPLKGSVARELVVVDLSVYEIVRNTRSPSNKTYFIFSFLFFSSNPLVVQ